MRKDMFKVIVERPRRGARFKMTRKKFQGEDDMPSRISPRRHRLLNDTSSKSLNENLAPLKRYLAKQAGRPWSKVYSEICENLHPNHTVKQHVRDHIEDFVVIKISVGRDGRWMRNAQWHCSDQDDMHWWPDLYVDPNDGILKETAKLRKKFGIKPRPWCSPYRPPPPDPNIRVLDERHELHRIDGLWFEVTFEHNTNPPPGEYVRDALSKTLKAADQRYAVSKRQLSKAELKANRLENEPY